MTRADLAAAYAGVTPFDLAVDAWRAETPADVERTELAALVVVGFAACRDTPVVSPAGKTSDPLDSWTTRARARVGGVRDYMSPLARAAAAENELLARHAIKQRRHDAWQEKQGRIERFGARYASGA